MRHRQLLLLLGLGFLLRIALIHAYPPIFGGDSVTRLAHHDRIIISQQLPALQTSIFLLSRLSDHPLLIRYWMAFLGALAGLAFYSLSRDLQLPPLAALLFVTHPYILAVSTVPYQEILMLAALCGAFHFHFNDRPVAASLLLGLACLTRYEAWAACPVLAFDYARSHRRPVAAVALHAWAPLAWMLYHSGLTPAGTYAIELPQSFARLQRYAYLGWITIKFTPILTLLLAALGALRLPSSPRWRLLLAFLVLFLAAIPFSAHGVPPDPERYVTSREVHLILAGVLLLAGAGLSRFPRYAALLVTIACLAGVYGAAGYVRRETSDPRVQLAYQLAQYLDRTLGPTESALILSPGPPAEGIQAYFDRARRSGQEAAARRLVETLAGPDDYFRTRLHARLSGSRLFSRTARDTDWVVVWSDYTGPTPPLEAPPVATLHAGPLAATVYRRRPAATAAPTPPRSP